jgi:hypothetical protein
VVIDEPQDIGVPQLRFLAALAGDRSDSPMRHMGTQCQ